VVFIKAILLAVVEGLTEFLPISSTGHLILLDRLVRLSSDSDFTDAFIVMIQLPAILSVVLYFWKDLWPFHPDGAERRARFGLWLKIVLAFLPAAVLGVLFGDFIEAYLFNPGTVAAALLVGGIVLIVLEKRRRPGQFATARDIPVTTALLIGLIQCVAMIPGTSRSAATIIGAMLLGSSRVAAAEFSFFLAIPTMAGATAYTVAKRGLHFDALQWAVLGVGSVVSFLVALAVVAALMKFIQHHGFTVFGWYRIALALVVIWYFFLRLQ
jgi:undecaprenyl-diphosphatase